MKGKHYVFKEIIKIYGKQEMYVLNIEQVYTWGYLMAGSWQSCAGLGEIVSTVLFFLLFFPF